MVKIIAHLICVSLCAQGIQAQWHVVFEGASTINFNGLSFINDSVGYTTVNEFVNSESEFYQLNMIWKTTDYGVSWDTIYYEIDYCQCPSDSIYNFTDVFFLNESLGWVSAAEKDKIWKTSDGGESWQIIDTGLNEQVGGPIQASDFQNIVFYSSDYGIIQNGNGGLHSMETFDGGITWLINDEYNCWDISMVDPCTIGFVDGGFIKSISNCNYSSQPFPTAQDNPNRNGTCIEYWSEENFICGAMGYNGSNFASVLKSVDGGLSYYILDLFWASACKDIEFYDSQNGYISVLPNSSNNSAAMLKSTDGGYTWYSQEIEQNQMGQYPALKRIRCQTPNVAYGISNREIYRTLNGGGPLGIEYVSAKDNSDEQIEFKIFPNPATALLQMQFATSGLFAEYSLYDMLGHMIMSGAARGNSDLDISHLSRGLYQVRITTSTETYSTNFIKE